MTHPENEKEPGIVGLSWQLVLWFAPWFLPCLAADCGERRTMTIYEDTP